MSVLKSIEPEIVYTSEGKKKATHEAYCYTITPFQNPPIKVLIYKGLIDRRGQFQTLGDTQHCIDITAQEFKELLDPNPNGKPAGDFRLSDVLSLVKRRTSVKPKEE